MKNSSCIILVLSSGFAGEFRFKKTQLQWNLSSKKKDLLIPYNIFQLIIKQANQQVA